MRNNPLAALLQPLHSGIIERRVSCAFALSLPAGAARLAVAQENELLTEESSSHLSRPVPCAIFFRGSKALSSGRFLKGSFRLASNSAKYLRSSPRLQLFIDGSWRSDDQGAPSRAVLTAPQRGDSTRSAESASLHAGASKAGTFAKPVRKSCRVRNRSCTSR